MRRTWSTILVGFSLLAAAMGTAAPTVSLSVAPRHVLNAGQSLELGVTATGSGTLAYQWTHNGRAIAGATASTCPVENFTRADAGVYLAHITDTTGTSISQPIFLIFAPGTGTPPVTQIRGWGANNLAQINVPAGLNDAVAISARSYNVLALRANGTAVSWGTYVTPVPAGLSGLVAIATGENHAVALKSDGTVVAWAANGPDPEVPAGLTNVVAVAAGTAHSLALKSDGTVVAWGAKPSQWFQPNGQAVVPAGLTDVVAIGAGLYFSTALKSDGTLVTWGGEPQYYTGLDQATNVRAIATDVNKVMMLKSDGTISGWMPHYAAEPLVVPAGLNNVTLVAAGPNHSLALQADGTVVAWGNNYDGQCTVPDGLPNVFALAGGQTFSLALRDASADAPPSLSTLAAQTVVEDQPATWTVTATGPGPFSYQWRKNGSPISGATAATFSIERTVLADAGNYDVVVTNYTGSNPSNAVALTVRPIPVITSQSAARQVLTAGQYINLSVSATGTGPLRYQWRRNGVAIPGETYSALARAGYIEESGWYVVDITDDNGTRRSPARFVTVAPGTTKVVGIGSNQYGQLSFPAATYNDVIATAASFDHSLLLRRDGSVVGLGRNLEGQSSIPAGLANVVAVAAGNGYSLALKSDGTVVGWGNNQYGQTDIPAGLSKVVAIAAGHEHAVALTSEGKVVTWGRNLYGQTNLPPSLPPLIAIAAAGNYNVGLTAEGTVVTWGYFTPYGGNATLAPPEGLDEVTAIATNGGQGFALRRNGSVVTWGEYSYAGDTLLAARDIVMVHASSAALAIRRDGSMITADSYGGLSTQKGVYALSGLGNTLGLVGTLWPTFFAQPADVTARETETAVLSVGVTGRDPLTYQWRRNGVNLPDTNSAKLVLKEVTLEQAGDYDVVVTNSSGTVTSTKARLSVTPVPAITYLSPNRQHLYLDAPLNLAVTATGTGPLHYQWYRNGHVIPGATQTSMSVAHVGFAEGGWYQVFVTDDNGTRRSAAMFVIVSPVATQVRGWGENGFGQAAPPVRLTDAVAVAGGSAHALALRANGTVVAWGWNVNGVLNVPASATNVVAIAADSWTSLALKADGTVLAWGEPTNPLLAVPAGLKNVVALASSGSHALALKSNGTVVAWGSNSRQQSDVPENLTDIVAIAANDGHSVAIDRDGRVFVWGLHASGAYFYNVPQPTIPAIAVSAGGNNGVTLLQDGTITPWGYLFQGGSTQYPTNLQNVTAVSASFAHSLALKADGTVVGWGPIGWLSPNEGAPPPADLAHAFAISAGYLFALAIADVSYPVFTTHPRSQSVAPGVDAVFSVGVANPPVATCRWQHLQAGTWQDIQDNTLWSGTATPTLTIAATAAGSLSGSQFRCVATNYLGSTPSNPAKLVVRTVAISPPGDLDGDGTSDVVWRHAPTGLVASWTSGGGFHHLGSEDANWQIAGSGDVDGDGLTDMLWRYVPTGLIASWTSAEGYKILGSEDANWKMVCTGDFDGDRFTDLLWRYGPTGSIVTWASSAGYLPLGSEDANWKAIGAGDFDGDDYADVLWRHVPTGSIVTWTSSAGYLTIGTEDANWRILGTGDYDGDGTTDVLWRYAPTGAIGSWTSSAGYRSMGTEGSGWTAVGN